MRNTDYDQNCKGCQISQGREDVLGEIMIELDGDWILNHYGACDQTFLGWMALQPKKHVMEWVDLNDAEAAALGGNIKKINKAIRDYWLDNFGEDPVERVYVVYFFEGFFDEPEERPYRWHMHIHLIPRPKSFDQLLRKPMANGTTISAWDIHQIRKHEHFPQVYEVTRDENKHRAIHLMTWLRHTLQHL